MQYCVVEEKNTKKLEEQVNLLLSQGWKPQGGVCAVVIAPALNVWYYQQAMVKEG
jgi:hypothetical protein